MKMYVVSNDNSMKFCWNDKLITLYTLKPFEGHCYISLLCCCCNMFFFERLLLNILKRDVTFSHMLDAEHTQQYLKTINFRVLGLQINLWRPSLLGANKNPLNDTIWVENHSLGDLSPTRPQSMMRSEIQTLRHLKQPQARGTREHCCGKRKSSHVYFSWTINLEAGLTLHVDWGRGWGAGCVCRNKSKVEVNRWSKQRLRYGPPT